MNISIEITKDLMQYMDKKVGRGYKSRSEVVRDAIRRMIREDIRQEARLKGLAREDFEKARDDVAKGLLKEKYR